MKSFMALLFGMLVAVSNADAATYKIDQVHSSVGFKIKHLTISSVTGRFTDFSGTFAYDPADVAASKAEAEIVVTRINTEEVKRDDHLRSPEFFDIVQFPEIKFISTEIRDPSPESFKVTGNLTIHGVTKPIVLDVTFGGIVKDPYGHERAAFSATAKINRRDFGLNYNKALEAGGLLVGEEVTINIEVEGVKLG